MLFDHVTIRVADRAAAERFFETVLEPLGIDPTYRIREFTEWHEFMVAQATDAQPATSGVHIAFAAPSREQVDAFWQAGIDAGYGDDGPPGPRPHYRKDYYGGFLRDPGGNSIEAVHYHASPRRDRIVDHIWLRVSDLPATRRFYELAGESAGFRLRSGQQDHRATFGHDDGAPSFTLVPGPATRHLHIAFPGDDDAVRRFHDGAVAAGYRSNGGPGERSRYHPGYYAAYVLDPDGNNIEVVNHHRD